MGDRQLISLLGPPLPASPSYPLTGCSAAAVSRKDGQLFCKDAYTGSCSRQVVRESRSKCRSSCCCWLLLLLAKLAKLYVKGEREHISNVLQAKSFCLTACLLPWPPAHRCASPPPPHT